jgi:hypothetical protein
VSEPTHRELIAESNELVARSKEHLEELRQSQRDTREAIGRLRAQGGNGNFRTRLPTWIDDGSISTDVEGNAVICIREGERA